MDTKTSLNFTIYKEKSDYKNIGKFPSQGSENSNLAWGGGDCPGPGGPEVVRIS